MITSERLKLEPISHAHAAALYELWSDFEAIKYTYAPLLETQEECEQRVDFFIEVNNKNLDIHNFSIVLNEKAIGLCGFPPMNKDKGEYGFYYQLCKSKWKQGYGYEAANALLKHVIDNSNVTCVYADAVTVNAASISILKRLGFEQTHIEQSGFNRNGFLLDLVHFKYIK